MFDLDTIQKKIKEFRSLLQFNVTCEDPELRSHPFYKINGMQINKYNEMWFDIIPVISEIYSTNKFGSKQIIEIANDIRDNILPIARELDFKEKYKYDEWLDS